jgi:hypothetical protein
MNGISDTAPPAASVAPRPRSFGAVQFLIQLGLLAACLATVYQRRLATFDDSFIYARVVHNLLDGHYWSFNPDRAIDTCTSPLYFALLLAISFCLKNILTAMVVLPAVLLGATVLLLFRYLRSGGAHWILATLACLGFLHNPFVQDLNGVETLLMLALSLAALLAYRRQNNLLTAFLLALLS